MGRIDCGRATRQSAEFPWLWIVPAVVALRYGSVIGIVAVLTYFGGWLAFEVLQLITTAFPKSYFLGGLILVLLCGQFSDVWNSRQRRLRAVNAYLDERLNSRPRAISCCACRMNAWSRTFWPSR